MLCLSKCKESDSPQLSPSRMKIAYVFIHFVSDGEGINMTDSFVCECSVKIPLDFESISAPS